jgi:hypothetical protein
MKMFSKFNEWLAVRITLAAFTMEAVYLCIVLSVLPLLNSDWMNTILFISNAVQLTLLSVVGVGSAVLSRKQEIRAIQDHAALVELVNALHDKHDELHDKVGELRR